MTRDEIIQRLQHLRKQIQFRHDRFMELAVAGEASLVTDAEDAAEHVAALDQALAELTAHASAAPSMSSAAVTDAHADQPFRVGVNEADETDPHLRMLGAPSSPAVEQAHHPYTETECPYGVLQGDVDALIDVSGHCLWEDWYPKLDTLIAAVRAERAQEEPVKPIACVGCEDGIHAKVQDRIAEHVMKLCGAKPGQIDGSGCDSGDPVDLTLDEIGQGFTILIDRHDEAIEALKARPVSGDHNGSVSGGVGVGRIDCQPAVDLRRAGTDCDDAGHTPKVEVATPPAAWVCPRCDGVSFDKVCENCRAPRPTPPAGTRERIIVAGQIYGRHLGYLAAACEVLTILEERIRAKFTPALNTGTPMDALVLVAEAIRELQAELTPSEDRE